MMLFEELHLFSDPVARGGPEQMAVDEVLLETVEKPVLRVYRWEAAAVSFGYSQSLSAARRAHAGWPCVRRWTGGGIVKHGVDWTFSLVVPMGEPLAKMRPAESYRRIHEVLTGQFKAFASDARLTRDEECVRGDVCFASPTQHDVMAGDGTKICGGAQRRTRRGLLHQGSVQNIKLPEEFVGRVAEAFSERVRDFSMQFKLKERVDELVAEKYGAAGWNGKTP
jgi:lipoate-protein ligase A